MDKQKQDLIIFGYGLGLIIPYIIMVHALKPAIGFFFFLLGFFAVLFVVAKSQTIKPLYYVVLAAVLAVTFKFGSDHIGFKSILFLIISGWILVIANWRFELLTPLYKVFTKVAHFIGQTITTIVLSVFYYFIFGIAGIVLRLLGKDLLDRKIEPERSSYWLKREQIPFDKYHYTRQF